MDKKNLIRSLRDRGFSEKIVEVFENSDRSKFVPKEFRQSSYADIPFPIGFGQTTSQPYTIAFMLTLLRINDGQKILEVGSGSGYVVELLSRLSPNGKIFGIERIKALAERSKKILKECNNVSILYGDGFKGLKKEAPFDRILVSAKCKSVPQALLSQLKIKGILVAPVETSIVVVKKDSGENKVKEYPGFIFVPMKRGVEK